MPADRRREVCVVRGYLLDFWKTVFVPAHIRTTAGASRAAFSPLDRRQTGDHTIPEHDTRRTSGHRERAEHTTRNRPAHEIARFLHRSIRGQDSKALRDEVKVEGKLRLQKRYHDAETIPSQRLVDRPVKVHADQHVAQVPWPAAVTSEKKEEACSEGSVVTKRHRRRHTEQQRTRGCKAALCDSWNLSV